jgi:class 3 adenylate cyclase
MANGVRIRDTRAVSIPEIQFAKNGDVHIAYQVLGDGPIDLVVVPHFVSNLALAWEDPASARYLNRLASFSRLIVFDKRGTGLSDRKGGIAPLEDRIDDMLAVLDAVGSERAAIFGASEGGAMSILFAATYPERTSALVLYGAYPRAAWAPDYPDGMPIDELNVGLDAWTESWGHGVLAPVYAPSLAEDPEFLQWMGRYELLSASPGEAATLARMIAEIDVRHVLPTISVPTLVVYRADEFIGHVAGSRFLAEHIPGARYIELPGTDYAPQLGDQDAIVDAVAEFLTGERSAPDLDRVLATVLFTDIVGSTEQAARMGDRRWREILDRHDAAVAHQARRFRGRQVRSTGDGALAVFDGPARAVHCAFAIRDALRSFGVEVRAGLHTGEIERRGDDIAGIGVHISARVAAVAGGGEVLVSETIPPLVVGSGLRFDDHGDHELKGVPGTWRLFAVDLDDGASRSSYAGA